VEINDLIYITDLEQVYIYSVSFKEIVNPESTYLIEDIPDRKMITLVTCDDARGTRRLVIQGELIETVEYHNDFFEST
jgi:sortase A